MKPIIPKTKFASLTEARYDLKLRVMKQNGEIIDYRYEPFNLRLADGAAYKPDFLVVYPDRFEFHEVKGYWREAARVRFKIAAKELPWFIFRVIEEKRGALVITETLNG